MHMKIISTKYLTIWSWLCHVGNDHMSNSRSGANVIEEVKKLISCSTLVQGQQSLAL